MNNEPITITATVRVYNTNAEWMPNDEILERATEGRPVLNYLHLTPTDMKEWSLVGSAEVKLTLFPRDEMVKAELASLNAAMDAARSEWLAKQQTILERINKLQALTNEVEA